MFLTGLSFAIALVLIGGFLIVLLYIYLHNHAIIQWGADEAYLDRILPHCLNCGKRMVNCTHGIPGFDHDKSQSRFCYPGHKDPEMRQLQTTHR